MIAELLLQVQDDFIPGKCEKCPLSELRYYEDESGGTIIDYVCVLNSENLCPLKPMSKCMEGYSSGQEGSLLNY